MNLTRLLQLLREEYDVHYWWPSESPFEVMVGAILVQQTSWEGVAKVLDQLRQEGLLQVDRMASCDIEALESIVRPVGFYRQKAKRIKGLAEHIRDRHGSDPNSMLEGPTEEVRGELLSLAGSARRPPTRSWCSLPGGRSSWPRQIPQGSWTVPGFSDRRTMMRYKRLSRTG